MKVKRNTLLLLACLVWSAAGFNILRIGLMENWLKSILPEFVPIRMNGIFFSSSLMENHLLLWQL